MTIVEAALVTIAVCLVLDKIVGATRFLSGIYIERNRYSFQYTFWGKIWTKVLKR